MRAHHVAATTEEKIATTLGMLRACDLGQTIDLSKYHARYPYLRMLAATAPVSASCLLALREHAVELARMDVWDRVEELRSVQQSMPEYEYHMRKDNILRLLQRLLPGGQKGLSVMASTDGSFITGEPSEMADLLRQHWSGVFTRKQTKLLSLRSWIDSYSVKFDVHELASCKLERSHVVESVKNARDSSPGSDGVPYKAWRKLGPLAIDVLYEAALALQDPATLQSLPEDFNATFLCCLPASFSSLLILDPSPSSIPTIG